MFVSSMNNISSFVRLLHFKKFDNNSSPLSLALLLISLNTVKINGEIYRNLYFLFLTLTSSMHKRNHRIMSSKSVMKIENTSLEACIILLVEFIKNEKYLSLINWTTNIVILIPFSSFYCLPTIDSGKSWSDTNDNWNKFFVNMGWFSHMYINWLHFIIYLEKSKHSTGSEVSLGIAGLKTDCLYIYFAYYCPVITIQRNIVDISF